MNEEIAVRPVLDSEVATWRVSVGNRKVQHVMADAEVLRRFALVTGADADVERQAPTLSHWALFVDTVPDDKIGADGHPVRGDFLPAVHLPRRMFAGAVMEFHAPLQVGKSASCLSTVTSVNHKRGQTGDLVFVNVRREISQADRLCVTEEQTFVYRAAGKPLKPVREVDLKLPDHIIWSPGSVELFRFSAVTFNGHRIHYDRRYAQEVEGYPDLVVHGPFTATKLLDYAGQCMGRAVRRFEFRGNAPLFVSQPVRLSAGVGPGSFVATRCDGTNAMTAQVEFS